MSRRENKSRSQTQTTSHKSVKMSLLTASVVTLTPDQMETRQKLESAGPLVHEHLQWQQEYLDSLELRVESLERHNERLEEAVLGYETETAALRRERKNLLSLSHKHELKWKTLTRTAFSSGKT